MNGLPSFGNRANVSNGVVFSSSASVLCFTNSLNISGNDDKPPHINSGLSKNAEVSFNLH